VSSPRSLGQGWVRQCHTDTKRTRTILTSHSPVSMTGCGSLPPNRRSKSTLSRSESRAISKNQESLAPGGQGEPFIQGVKSLSLRLAARPDERRTELQCVGCS
jgi:hypothetical protein